MTPRSQISLIMMLSTAVGAAFAQDVESQPCPSDFHHMPLHESARLCQTFDDAMPASLVYYAKVKPAEAAAFYQQQADFTFSYASVKGRTVLTTQSQDKIVIISEDGDGSQVDILIK